ncbi:MAG TPA: tetratricopeptide repeat protein [Gammaproteobacteria bacterium]|nr:tetratricopeptide repeat protein [Gammaproteobacteria bacterium]
MPRWGRKRGGALEAALEVNPVLYEAQYYLGRCYERQGNDRLAAERFQAALIAKPDYHKARSALKRVDPTAGPARGIEGASEDDNALEQN